MLVAKESQKKIKEENLKSGLKSIKEYALLKLLQGISTLEEYMKIN